MNITWIALAGGAAALTTVLLGLALAGLWQARRARRDVRTLDTRLAASATQAAELAAEAAAGQRRCEELAGQLEQLKLQLGRVDGTTLRLGLREAIALSRRGADVQEIVATCGIGYGEARLIGMLHGRAPAEATGHEFN